MEKKLICLITFIGIILIGCQSPQATQASKEQVVQQGVQQTLAAASVQQDIQQTIAALVTPTLVPTLVPTVSSPVIDEQAFINTVISDSTKCASILKDFSILATTISKNASLIYEQQWVDQFLNDLSEIETICGHVGKTSNVPASFAKANEYLLRANAEFSGFASLARTGILAKDVNTISQSIPHMVNATNFINLAAAYFK